MPKRRRRGWGDKPEVKKPKLGKKSNENNSGKK